MQPYTTVHLNSAFLHKRTITVWIQSISSGFLSHRLRFNWIVGFDILTWSIIFSNKIFYSFKFHCIIIQSSSVFAPFLLHWCHIYLSIYLSIYHWCPSYSYIFAFPHRFLTLSLLLTSSLFPLSILQWSFSWTFSVLSYHPTLAFLPQHHFGYSQKRTHNQWHLIQISIV